MTGYFGKVSTLGDFVSRGLPDGLVAAWDAWLQHYLTSPVWRFAIAPGVLGPEGLGGVMMPSVDRVGRYFPLMIGAVGAPPLLDWFHKHAAWYDAIEDLARASLDPAFRLAQFDAMPTLASIDAAQAAIDGGAWRFALEEGVGERVAAVALQGHTLWWTDGAPGVEPSMLMCAGMPRAGRFAAMLNAR